MNLALTAPRGPLRIPRGILAGLRLVLNPTRLNDVFHIEEAVTSDASLDELVKVLRTHERGRRALKERHRLGKLDLPRLRTLDEGTFGRAVADFFDAHGLDPSSIPTKSDATELAYARAHLFETHDIWHVATGFDVDVAGELGVQSFYRSQFPGALPPWLLVGGLLNAIFRNPRDYDRRLDAIARGWMLGKRAEPLFGVRWDLLFETPLVEVRRMFRLDDGTNARALPSPVAVDAEAAAA